jgi:hypothetical protein
MAHGGPAHPLLHGAHGGAPRLGAPLHPSRQAGPLSSGGGRMFRFSVAAPIFHIAAHIQPKLKPRCLSAPEPYSDLKSRAAAASPAPVSTQAQPMNFVDQVFAGRAPAQASSRIGVGVCYTGWIGPFGAGRALPRLNSRSLTLFRRAARADWPPGRHEESVRAFQARCGRRGERGCSCEERRAMCVGQNATNRAGAAVGGPRYHRRLAPALVSRRRTRCGDLRPTMSRCGRRLRRGHSHDAPPAMGPPLARRRH